MAPGWPLGREADFVTIGLRALFNRSNELDGRFGMALGEPSRRLCDDGDLKKFFNDENEATECFVPREGWVCDEWFEPACDWTESLEPICGNGGVFCAGSEAFSKCFACISKCAGARDVVAPVAKPIKNSPSDWRGLIQKPWRDTRYGNGGIRSWKFVSFM